MPYSRPPPPWYKEDQMAMINSPLGGKSNTTHNWFKKSGQFIRKTNRLHKLYITHYFSFNRFSLNKNVSTNKMIQAHTGYTPWWVHSHWVGPTTNFLFRVCPYIYRVRPNFLSSLQNSVFDQEHRLAIACITSSIPVFPWCFYYLNYETQNDALLITTLNSQKELFCFIWPSPLISCSKCELALFASLSKSSHRLTNYITCLSWTTGGLHVDVVCDLHMWQYCVTFWAI